MIRKPMPVEDKSEPQITFATVKRLTKRGDVDAITISLAKRVVNGVEQWDVWVEGTDDPLRVAVAVGLPAREQAEQAARDYVRRIEAANEQAVRQVIALASEQMGYDEYATRALLQRMTSEAVGLRRGWIVNRRGLPDVQLPRCESEAQAAVVLARALEQRVEP